MFKAFEGIWLAGLKVFREGCGMSALRGRLASGFIGALAGAIIVWLVWQFVFLKLLKHRYEEAEIFFKGSVAGYDVRGISYFDLVGMTPAPVQWKVVLVKGYCDQTVVYQSKSDFVGEGGPSQPEVKIEGDRVLIDDGLTKLNIQVQTKPDAVVPRPK